MKYALLFLLAIMQVVLNAVFLYRRHDKVSRTFTYFTTLLLIWTTINIALDYTTTSQAAILIDSNSLKLINTLNIAGFTTACLLLIMLHQTVLVSQGISMTKYSKATVISGCILAVLAMSPSFSGAYYIKNNALEYHYGSISLLFIPYFILLSWSTLGTVLKKAKSKLSTRERQQTLVVILALFLSAAWGIIFIIVLPLLTKNNSLIFVGYLAPYIFTMLMFYGIIWLGLLNFRQIIARSIGYLLSLAVMGGLFVAIIKLIVGYVSRDALTSEQTIIFTIVSFALALAFRPAKGFFDRFTNRIFYRDAYDAELVFNKLSRLIVNAYDINMLIRSVAQLLYDELKVSYVAIQLDKHKTFGWPTVGFDYRITPIEKVFRYCAHIQRNKENIISTELLDINAKNEVDKITNNQDISVIVKLTSSAKQHDTSFGYIVLGQKRSGSMYASQDTRVLESISNELSLAIQNALHFEEIQNFNATLQEKVEDATRKLRVTNEKLKKLDETKDEFVSMASHQLRTPLTSVKGYLSMVIEGDAGPLNQQQEELLKQSFMSSQRMVNLIADLLNLSRLSTGKFVIDATPTDLRVVVDQEIAGLRETAKAKRIEMLWTMPKTFSLLPLDENKIHQVVMNFIDNALYYTPEDGKVSVELIETPKAVEFRVKDNGIGVPRELQRHLFTKFYRADNARRMRPDGTGLGLYMAKKVVVAQGGSIIFESQEGKGSTFGFRFRKELTPAKNVEVA